MKQYNIKHIIFIFLINSFYFINGDYFSLMPTLSPKESLEFDSELMLKNTELDIISANPSETFVYFDYETIEAIKEIPNKDEIHSLLIKSQEHFKEEFKTMTYDVALEVVSEAIKFYKSYSNSKSKDYLKILKTYQKGLEEGENIIVVKDFGSPFVTFKRKVFCSLCATSAIIGSLRVSEIVFEDGTKLTKGN